MNRILKFSLFSFILLTFTACDYEGTETYKAWSTITPSIVYQADAANKYEIAFGDYTGDELTHVPDQYLTSRLKVWLVKDSVTKNLQLDTVLTLQRSQTISLIQLASGAAIQLYTKPSEPEKTSVQRTQLFYSSTSQPDSVRVTIVGVDKYNFMLTAKYDFNKANPLDTVASFTLKRNKLSPYIDLDLNRFNGGTKGYEAWYFYSVRNAATGAIVQAFNKSVRFNIDQVSTAVADRFKAKYKLTLMQWGYSSAYPFSVPTVLLSTGW